MSSQLRLPLGHLFPTAQGPHLLLSDGTRIYGLDDDAAAQLQEAWDSRDQQQAQELLRRFGLDAPAAYIDDQAPESMPVRALSLAVAQKCNLGCVYCYAQEGSFGGKAQNMPLETALASVDRLFEEAGPGDRVQLAFLGGEPLVNRPVLRQAADYAHRQARRKGIKLGLSLTTNGTLLTSQDGDFLERHGFSVTVSLDGLGESHDQSRPFKDGRGSFERILKRVRPLLAKQRRMQVSARVTVTPGRLDLPSTLEGLIEMGFHSVGFSPMLSSPTGRAEMRADDLKIMLDQMIACGRQFEERLRDGARYPFSNLTTALKEIHRGTHRPYPCGAGGGYFGVSAQGDLFACHRFVDDPSGAMGSLEEGLDRGRQAQWLQERHVHFQQPCSGCWARYLCGGGCHHEVIHRGRPACDYIRGWLHYCLQAYVRLLKDCPKFFAP
ncbi:MAG TPA: radical SAM protein [Acidobacteriota bacterium]|nr:radical SAM protein [Acidobacteriota bacterium]